MGQKTYGIMFVGYLHATAKTAQIHQGMDSARPLKANCGIWHQVRLFPFEPVD